MGFAPIIMTLVILCRCCGWALDKRDSDEESMANLTKFLNGMEGKRHLKLIRPMSGGKAVEVKVGIFIVYIGNFRESIMEYSMEMYFRQYWKDPRLAFAGMNDSVTFSGELPDILWQPDTYFENGLSGKLHHLTVLNKYLRLYPDGRVLVSTRLTLSCSCDMNFRKFPMDAQICDLNFASYGFTTRDLIYSWNDEFAAYTGDKENAQFLLKTFRYLNGTRTYATGNFSYLGIRFVFVRRLSFYLTKIYIPAMLVVFVSWLSFFVDRNSAPARVSLGITTVLTMTTLIMGFGQDSLPVVSYMRALDLYLIVCYLLVFGSFAEYALVNYRNKPGNKRISEQSAYHEGTSSSEGTLNGELGNMPASSDVENKISFPRQTQQEFIMEHESSVLDKWSRWIFLPTFLVLNLFYWIYYLVIDKSNIPTEQ